MGQGMDHLMETAMELIEENELIEHSTHKKAERKLLHLRNATVAIAVIMFATSLFPIHCQLLCKATGYFFGAVAYLCEILMLTDCFSRYIPHTEAFMAYCFGPLYIIMGVSYLMSNGH